MLKSKSKLRKVQNIDLQESRDRFNNEIRSPFLLNDLNVLYIKFYSVVQRELRKLGCSSMNFNDIYQEAFILLFEKQMTSIAVMRNPQSYITQMCKFMWFKERKRKDKHEMLNEDEPYLALESSSGNELRQLLSKHLGNLSKACREILTLYSLGYSEKKIGTVLKIGDRNAIKNKKFNCKSKLRSLIENDPSYKEING